MLKVGREGWWWESDRRQRTSASQFQSHRRLSQSAFWQRDAKYLWHRTSTSSSQDAFSPHIPEKGDIHFRNPTNATAQNALEQRFTVDLAQRCDLDLSVSTFAELLEDVRNCRRNIVHRPSRTLRRLQMRDQLDHLPQTSQRELAHVVRVLFEEFEAALRIGTTKWKKQGRIFKIVLYGSYARGDWVSDPVGGYQSDYDILIVVNDERLADFEFWSAAEDRLMRDATINKALAAPVSFIAHSLTDVNAQLERGRPFFVDIVEQGVALYEAEGFAFAAPTKLPPEAARAEAQKHFDEWYPSSTGFARNAGYAVRDGDNKLAAFLFHQAAERAYHCALLVLTLYSPKSHRLNFLRSQCEQIAPTLTPAWPRATKFERRCFELLRQAYVNARYSPHYAITDDELAWIGEHVALLLSLVETVCRAHLEQAIIDG